ncbi:chaperone protein dnaJ 49 [Artemisia annua]|uniref:Chaperone protein dnaJ 49 n=1 Tax=Artemisia annua TaxID=35608 RepID=A0A2U1LZ61_ARTAN|nr:chaperone protein dnaJ 49 [Artemisia annua]
MEACNDKRCRSLKQVDLVCNSSAPAQPKKNVFKRRFPFIRYRIAIILIGYEVLFPSYSITMHKDYELPMMTEEYGIEFYVKSLDEFEKEYPVGTHARARVEDRIMKEYIKYALNHCAYEKETSYTTPRFSNSDM